MSINSTASIPGKMQALMTRFLRSPFLYTIPVPTPAPNELLIKVVFVSLNPTDHKHAHFSLPPSKVIGCDFSGTVISQAPSNSSSPPVSQPQKFCPGDRVAGILHGCSSTQNGAFAEYCVADPNLCFRVPTNTSLEAACTLGVGWISAAQALEGRLYKKEPKAEEFDDGVEDSGPRRKSADKLRRKDSHNTDGNEADDAEDTLLIYSAATNTGMHSVQQARLCHPSTTIIAIASPQHHELLKSFGANEVFDYKSPTLVQDVRELGRDIRRGIDCHSEGNSSVVAAECMLPLLSQHPDGDAFSTDKSEHRKGGNEGRRLIRTLPPSMIRGTMPAGVRADDWILSYTAIGKSFWFLFKRYDARPEDYDAAGRYMRSLTELLEQGKVVPVPRKMVPGGLMGIIHGFEEMKEGRVRGEKVVVEVGKEGR